MIFTRLSQRKAESQFFFQCSLFTPLNLKRGILEVIDAMSNYSSFCGSAFVFAVGD